jgi:hypothetical protein
MDVPHFSLLQQYWHHTPKYPQQAIQIIVQYPLIKKNVSKVSSKKTAAQQPAVMAAANPKAKEPGIPRI